MSASESGGFMRIMSAPGLSAGASAIQLARCAESLGKSPLAMVVRLPTCVRFGPMTPGETPWIVWQPIQALRAYTALPRSAIVPGAGAAGPSSCSVAQHIHFEGAGGGLSGGREDRTHRRHGHENEDGRRGQGPGDLQERMAMRRLGSGAPLTVAEAYQRDDEQRLDDEEHAGCPPEDVGEEDVGSSREVGAGEERGLRERTATPGHDERGGGEPESKPARGDEDPHSSPSAVPSRNSWASGCRRHRIRNVSATPTAFPPRIRAQASPPRPTCDRIADTITNPSSSRKNANAAPTIKVASRCAACATLTATTPYARHST